MFVTNSAIACASTAVPLPAHAQPSELSSAGRATPSCASVIYTTDSHLCKMDSVVPLQSRARMLQHPSHLAGQSQLHAKCCNPNEAPSLVQLTMPPHLPNISAVTLAAPGWLGSATASIPPCCSNSPVASCLYSSPAVKPSLERKPKQQRYGKLVLGALWSWTPLHACCITWAQLGHKD